jgi:capsular exopolysaccharide synthesis family protein
VTLHDHLRVARKRWRAVLIGLLAGLAGAALITGETPPEYTAAATMYLSAAAEGDGGALAAPQNLALSDQRMNSYARLLTGNRVVQEVVDRLGLPGPAHEVEDKITASAQPGTVLLTVSATDRSPRTAMAIANAAAAAFTHLLAQLEQPPPNAPAAVTATIVEPAEPPTTPTGPDPTLDLGFGMLIGLLMGYGGAVLREVRDTGVKSVEDLTRLTGAPNLGTVSHDPGAPKHPLAMPEHPLSPHAEEFRTLRANLRFVGIDRPAKTVVVTSARPGEGKTTTLGKLAISLVRAGQRVVLVETDLRRPRPVGPLALDRTAGLTSVLSGRVSLDRALQTSAALFDVLLSGPIPPNPGELLASRQMVNLLAELRERYDMVLLDAPPLLSVSDAAVLGASCDGVLLVVRYGKTGRNRLRSAVTVLEQSSARLLGTAFTMTPQSGPRPAAEPHPAREPVEPSLHHTTPLATIPAALAQPDLPGDGKGRLTGCLPVGSGPGLHQRV